MNYLMDTHAFLWSVTEKNKLSALARQTLENPENSIYVSAITFWEVSLKFSIGKLQLHGILPEDLPQLALQTGFQIISLSAKESATYHKLKLTNHRDPFDRMLVWQAIYQSLVFITKDESMAQYRIAGLKVLW